MSIEVKQHHHHPHPARPLSRNRERHGPANTMKQLSDRGRLHDVISHCASTTSLMNSRSALFQELGGAGDSRVFGFDSGRDSSPTHPAH